MNINLSVKALPIRLEERHPLHFDYRVGQPLRPLQRGINAFLKRVFDVSVAGVALLVLSPFFIAISIMALVQKQSPIFLHPRIGKGGVVFNCLKFRSMVPDAELRLYRYLAAHPEARQEWDATHKLTNDPRITKTGAFLRKTSLDELPQLFNVLKGEMSLVGPRPIVAEEMPRYGQLIADYVSVRPGITGLWQVSGRSDTTYSERVALDANYVHNWSFVKDIGIMVRTIPCLLSRRGAY